MILTYTLPMSRVVSHPMMVYIVILHLVLILLISGRGRRFVPIFRQQDSAIKNAHFQSQMRAFHRRIDEMAESGSILFIGASGIQGMNLQRLGGKGVNFGIGGDTTDELLERLPAYTSLGTARAVVLSVGFNDLKAGLGNRTIGNFKAILGQLPIGLPVIVCSISEVSESKNDQGINECIRDLNSKLQVMVEEKANVKFLDISKILLQKFEGRKERYLEDDGVHLNRSGRRAWMDVVVRALDSVFESATSVK
jgi:lysophospholipase L1-like esterase